MSDVHLRLRKCLSRCTLDCGFKTSESPHCGLWARGLRLGGTSLYLVLKSNGLPYPKIQLKKFSFHQNCSRKYLQKVAATTLFQTVPHRIFNFSHKWPTFAFHRRKWVKTPRLSEKDRTAWQHTAKHGTFRMGVVSLPSIRAARSRISPGQVGIRTAKLCRFVVCSGGVLPRWALRDPVSALWIMW